jgi:protocatechuate 3,4-dioxygenase beta subunit
MRAVLALFLVGAMAWSTATAAAAPRAKCAPTPNAEFGPDRGPIPLRAKIGTGHVLTGVVLSPACTPIAGARVSFWQSNAHGVYTAAGRGAVMTDKSGRFRFEGPMPVAYGGRPAHIHIRVEARDYETLYTEYEPHGAGSGNLRLVLVPAAL